MTYRIIVDSAGNLTEKDFPEAEGISFAVAPLTMTVGGKEYVDDADCDIEDMLKGLADSRNKASTSCPSPAEYLKLFEGADRYIVITLSSKLSGSFNSASAAKNLSEHPEDILVIDSMAALGAQELLLRAAIRLIQENTPFEAMESKIMEARKDVHLLFSFENYDSLLRAGRISKTAAVLGSTLHIKAFGQAVDGTIEMKDKVRTNLFLLHSYLKFMERLCPETDDRICVISHTHNENEAERLAEKIKEKFHFKEVIIRENRGLTSYYAREKSLIVAF